MKLDLLNNFLFSIQKNVTRVKGVFFVKSVYKRTKNLSPQSKANLNLKFIDKRDSFDNNIDKIRHIAIKILLMFDYLASENKFDYFLAYGSLLGCIRHKGFIPWDDDVDIMMTKSDFQKFLRVADQLPESITILPMAYNFVKIMDKHSKISLDGKRGVALDIFILDKEESRSYSFFNAHNQHKIVLEKKDLFPIQKLGFEEFTFSAPNNSNKILKLIYGDYMKLPPLDQRVSPHTNNESIHIYPLPEKM